MREQIINYLNELYPHPKCELNYNKDYELLLSVMLSAQTTDKSVNNVTSELYKKYDVIKTEGKIWYIRDKEKSNADVDDK